MKSILLKISLVIAFSMFITPVASASLHNLILSNGYTMDILTTGNWNSNINTDTGDMDTVLDINFAITTNDPNPITSMGFTACTTNSDSSQSDAIKSMDFTPGLTSSTASVVFGDADERPTDSAIQDCCGADPHAIDNSDAISYGGTLTIDNGGSFTYSESGNRHFDLNIDPTIQGDPTNLHYTLSCGCCAGTYDCDGANDAQGTYEVQICLTGIPN